MAPTAITGIVAFLVGIQSVIGLDFAPEHWNGFLLVLFGLITYIRQVVTGRSNWFGGRKK